MIQVKEIHRYPIKGLSVERLPRVTLSIRQGLPHDRVFAFARANAPFDPAAPKHLPKANFLEQLAIGNRGAVGGEHCHGKF